MKTDINSFENKVIDKYNNSGLALAGLSFTEYLYNKYIEAGKNKKYLFATLYFNLYIKYQSI